MKSIREFLNEARGKKTINQMSDETEQEIDNQVIKKYPARTISTYNTLKGYPELIDELETIVGGPLLSDEELDAPNFNGLFYKTSDKDPTQKLCVSKNSSALDALQEYGIKTKTNGDVFFNLPSGPEIRLHPSAKSKVFKYIKNITAFQEAVFAILMQLKVTNKTNVIPTPTDKKMAKYPVQAWLESSDPALGTGICKYLDYNVPPDDVEQFQNEINMILTSNNNGWRNCFETVWKTDWRTRIDQIFKQPPIWFKPMFIHDNLNLSASLKAAAEKYLGKARCGVDKDMIDKSDIVLVFNSGEATKLLNSCMKFDRNHIKEHNEYLNELVNNCKLLGISLKQVGRSITIAAVNFKIGTTAIGENINDEYKIAVQIDARNPNNCTFNCKEMVVPKFKKDVKTYYIDVPFNKKHEKDIHASSGSKLRIYIREAGGAVQLNFGLSNARAFLGKGNQAMKEIVPSEPGFNPIDITKIYKTAIESGKSTPYAVYIALKRVADLIRLHPWTFTKIFAKSVGYPIIIKDGKKTEYDILAAPYMKVF